VRVILKWIFKKWDGMGWGGVKILYIAGRRSRSCNIQNFHFIGFVSWPVDGSGLERKLVAKIKRVYCNLSGVTEELNKHRVSGLLFRSNKGKNNKRILPKSEKFGA
jgi:hypothetical protein